MTHTWHKLSSIETAGLLATDMEQGLSSEDAKK